METNRHIVYEESLFIEILIFYKTITNYLNDALPKDNNLSIYEIFFLTLLEKYPDGITYYELSKKLPFDKSYINKVIKRLEEKELVVKTKEGKKKQITLSNKSDVLLTKRPKLKENFIELLDKNDVSCDELNDFISLLKKLSKIIEDYRE